MPKTNMTCGSEQPSLTQVYGVTYTPQPEWKLGGAVESGMIFGDFSDGAFDEGGVAAHRAFAHRGLFPR